MLPGKKYTPEDYVRIAWARKWLIVVPTLVAAAGTIAVSHQLPDRYRSQATVLIVPQQVPTEYVQPTVTSRLDERLQSLNQQILSRTRLEALIREFNLYPEERKTMIMEDIVDQMRRRDIHVDIPRGNRRVDPGYFTVAFDSAAPRTAMRVTERLVGMFKDENMQDREVLAAQTTEFLQTQLADAKRKLQEQEAKLAAYRSAHAGELPAQVDSNLQVMQGLQQSLQALVEATNRDIDRRITIDQLLADANVQPVSAPVADNSDLPRGTAAEQLAAARASLAQTQLRLKADHPDVKRMQRAVADLEQKAEAEAQDQPLGVAARPAPALTPVEAAQRRRVADLQTERATLERRIGASDVEQKRLRDRIASYTARLEAAPAREAELTELMRDYGVTQQQYKDLSLKSQSSQVAQNLERRQIGQRFSIIDPARLPERPISPNRVRINAMGTLAGLAFGLALVGLLEYRDTTFKTDSDVIMSLALPVLATIPAMVTSAERRRRQQLRRLVWVGSLALAVSAAAVAVWRLGLIDAWVR
jgi:polysaccharide chain length determinant protein (PEP-CTERM system associated)